MSIGSCIFLFLPDDLFTTTKKSYSIDEVSTVLRHHLSIVLHFYVYVRDWTIHDMSVGMNAIAKIAANNVSAAMSAPTTRQLFFMVYLLIGCPILVRTGSKGIKNPCADQYTMGQSKLLSALPTTDF